MAKIALGIAIALAVILTCQMSIGATQDVKQNLREPKPLNLAEPFEKITRKLGNFNRNFNILKFLQFLEFLLMDCLVGRPDTQLDTERLQSLANASIKYVTEHEEEIMEKISAFGFHDICTSGWYDLVHTYVWEEDPRQSMNDIVKFFYRFGFPNAYKVYKGFYIANNCPEKLINMIPDGPDEAKQPILPQSKSTPKVHTYEAERENLLKVISTLKSSRENPLLQFQLKCEISELIGKLQATGLLDLLILINTMIHEVIQKPSIHFLIGKIQEPAKGKSFRELRQKDEIRGFFLKIDQSIKMVLECMTGLLTAFVENIFGLYVLDTNIVELLLSVFESLFWDNWDPVIPPPLESPNPC